jgi:hypothetical protein
VAAPGPTQSRLPTHGRRGGRATERSKTGPGPRKLPPPTQCHPHPPPLPGGTHPLGSGR